MLVHRNANNHATRTILHAFSGNGQRGFNIEHGDEVGGMVKSIRSNGTMTFVELGRFSPNVLAGQDVLVRNTLGEWVHGVIGVKPLAPPPRRKR